MTTDQIKLNWETFIRVSDELRTKNMGRTALLHDGEIIAIYDEQIDAYTIGCEKFGLGDFSIQTFGEETMHVSTPFDVQDI